MPAGYRTPEEAARGSIPAQFVQPIGVVIRGDRAIVAQLMNDGPPFEVETSHCHREADGSWTEGMSSNSTSGFLAGGDGQGTAVVWDVAPDKAVAARFVYDRREQVAVVEHGCAIAVFDDVPDENRWLLDGPFLTAWIDADGIETPVELPRFREEIAKDLQDGWGMR